ncbi:MAG TPA: hypothetical protein VGR53_04320 [Nitrososphaerales archaeon]|nr:hypothetical protein [Nitrososphaerales archaeon]
MSWNSCGLPLYKDCAVCGHKVRGPNPAILMTNYKRHTRNHEVNIANAGKSAIVVRGPPSCGKSTTCNSIITLAQIVQVTAKMIILDSFDSEGFVSDNRERTYPNLDGLKETWVVLEIGYGGFATKNPQTWARKLSGQGYPINLIRLTVSKDTAIARSNARNDGTTPGNTAAWWDRYEKEKQFTQVADKLALSEQVIETTSLKHGDAARMILQTLRV